MKLSIKNKKSLPAEIISIVESNNFLSLESVSRLAIPSDILGRILSILLNNPSYGCFEFEGMVYIAHTQSNNRNYAAVVPWAKLGREQ